VECGERSHGSVVDEPAPPRPQPLALAGARDRSFQEASWNPPVPTTAPRSSSACSTARPATVSSHRTSSPWAPFLPGP